MNKLLGVCLCILLGLTACSGGTKPTEQQQTTSSLAITSIDVPYPLTPVPDYAPYHYRMTIPKTANEREIVIRFNQPLSEHQDVPPLFLQNGSQLVLEPDNDKAKYPFSFRYEIRKDALVIKSQDGAFPSNLLSIGLSGDFRADSGETLGSNVYLPFEYGVLHPRTLLEGVDGSDKIALYTGGGQQRKIGFVKNVEEALPLKNRQDEVLTHLEVGEAVEIIAEDKKTSEYQVKVYYKKANAPDPQDFSTDIYNETYCKVLEGWVPYSNIGRIPVPANPAALATVIGTDLDSPDEGIRYPTLFMFVGNLSNQYATLEQDKEIGEDLMEVLTLASVLTWDGFAGESFLHQKAIGQRDLSETEREAHIPEADWSESYGEFYNQLFDAHLRFVAQKIDALPISKKNEPYKAYISEKLKHSGQMERIYTEWGMEERYKDLSWFIDKLNEHFPDAEREKQIVKMMTAPADPYTFSTIMHMFIQTSEWDALLDRWQAAYDSALRPYWKVEEHEHDNKGSEV